MRVKVLWVVALATMVAGAALAAGDDVRTSVASGGSVVLKNLDMPAMLHAQAQEIEILGTSVGGGSSPWMGNMHFTYTVKLPSDSKRDFVQKIEGKVKKVIEQQGGKVDGGGGGGGSDGTGYFSVGYFLKGEEAGDVWGQINVTVVELNGGQSAIIGSVSECKIDMARMIEDMKTKRGWQDRAATVEKDWAAMPTSPSKRAELARSATTGPASTTTTPATVPSVP